MTLAALGIVGTAAAASGAMAGMEGMSAGNSAQPVSSSAVASLIRFLAQVAPTLMLISVAAITVSLGLRRRAAVIPALLAGAVMYAGMYLQSGVPLMYGSIVLGLSLWTFLFVWTQAWRRPGLQADGTDPQTD